MVVDFNDKFREICRNYSVEKVWLFGSANTESFSESSDIDLIVEYSKSSEVSLIEHLRLKKALEGFFARKVDILTKQTVDAMKNPFRKQEIEKSIRQVYAA